MIEPDSTEQLQLLATQKRIDQAITTMFALEDDALRYSLNAMLTHGLPAIQISPIQGKLLQLLSFACQATRILEIGSLAGYSGIWLARSLPAHGRLITLEISPEHADVVRQSFAYAGLTDRTEVRVGNAVDLLPALQYEAPFDLIFIDADKVSYPLYLDWALKLARPGSIIVGDNCVRQGNALQASETMTADSAGLLAYNQKASTHPQLTSLALPLDDNYTDGFTISVVRSPQSK